eukprot:COSAG02_NODE_1201_length_13902_cov_4.383033_3_plen_540_part_00
MALRLHGPRSARGGERLLLLPPIAPDAATPAAALRSPVGTPRERAARAAAAAAAVVGAAAAAGVASGDWGRSKVALEPEPEPEQEPRPGQDGMIITSEEGLGVQAFRRRGATPLGRARNWAPASAGDNSEESVRRRPTPPPTTPTSSRQATLEASVIWHQQAGRDAIAEVAAVRAALLAAEQRVQTLERASQDTADAHADCARTLTTKLESMTAQVDRGRLTEQELEQELSDARATIDALRDELRTATSDHARKIAQLERRCEKRQWHHLEQELAEVQDCAAQAEAQYKEEITELRQAADQVPVLQELALSWRIVVERMEKQLQEEHAIAARAVDESAGLKGTVETRAAVADGTIARLSARAEAGDQQRAVLCGALDEWRRKIELERAGHAVEMSAAIKELSECKAALGKKNAEMVKLFAELTQKQRSYEVVVDKLDGQHREEAIKELRDALAEEKAAHAETKERAVRLLKRASAATEVEKAAHADTKRALSASNYVQVHDQEQSQRPGRERHRERISGGSHGNMVIAEASALEQRPQE